MVINKEVNPRFEKTYKVYKHVFPNGKRQEEGDQMKVDKEVNPRFESFLFDW